MAVNRYDVPSQDRYFNTYVDLPYEQIMGTVAARQGQLDKAQDALTNMYADTQNLKYIPGSKDEEFVRNYVSGVSDLVGKYYMQDMSDPVVANQLRSEFNKMTNRQALQNIQMSKAAWDANNKVRAALQAEGTYDPLLDEDPAEGWDTVGSGKVYNYIVSPYKNPWPTADSYFKDLKPGDLGNRGDYWYEGIDKKRIDEVVDAKWGSFADTIEGKQYVKKMAKQSGQDPNDPAVREKIAKEYLRGVGYSQWTWENRGGVLRETSRSGSKGKDGESSYNPLLVVEGPDKNISGAKKESKMYKADISEIYSIDKDIFNLSASLKNLQPGSRDYNSTMAMINDLEDRKNNINSTINAIESEIAPEYIERKNKIMSDFIAASKKKGISEEDAMAAFNAAMSDFGGRSEVGMAIASVAKNPHEEVKKFGVANYNRAKLAVANLNKVNSEINKKVKEAYPNLAQKRTHDNMYLLSGTGIGFSDTSPSYIGKDGRQTVSATSKVLGELRNQGAAFSRVSDITPGKPDDRFEDIEDMTTHIRNSDELSLSKVNPSISPNGDYKFIVNTNNEKDGNKSVKTFEVVLNKYTQPKVTQSFLDAFASDLIQNGNYTEALRLQDPELEIEFKAKKNDKESIIVPDKSKPNEYIRISKVGNDQYLIIDPEGRANAEPISYDDVVMQLYGWRVRDKYYED